MKSLLIVITSRAMFYTMLLLGLVHGRRIQANESVGLPHNTAACPSVVIAAEGLGPVCKEGEKGCIDETPQGRELLKVLRQGCAEGRAGEGSPCLRAVVFRRDGKVTAVCGPRLLEAQQ